MTVQIYELTKPEIDKLVNLCNFTPDEMEYFLQRAKNKSHTEIGFNSHWSDRKVTNLSRSVKRKIKKVEKET